MKLNMICVKFHKNKRREIWTFEVLGF